METAGLDPATTVVVGDSNHDATMAASWNMAFIAITSGAGPLGPAQTDARRLEVRRLSDAAALVLLRPQGGRLEP
jgi:phosphoglycolate phosphatase-like HAD superfamily hydrolase